MLVAEDVKVLFDFLIHLFSLTIALRVVSCSETHFNAEVLIQGSHKMCCKLQAAIRIYLLWDTMESEYIFVVEVSNTFSRDVVMGECEMGLTREVVDIGANRVMAV